MAATGASVSAVRFLGARAAYWRLLSRGAALLMITLGIYRFWLATDVRRFLWANTEIDGETLEYTGTPLELLLGFLVAVTILIPVYAGFFLAALDLGTYGRLSGLIAFAGLGVLGQYAVYRARRYRLTRTIYRGLRFHLEGSAWAYALRAAGWWAATALTLGLAYPFQLASLERYKMSNTYYGDLAGHFAGSSFKLMLRGLPMWLLVIGPLALAAGAFIDVVDWKALADALNSGGDDLMGRIEGGNPGLGAVIVFAMLMGGTAGGMAALLYPAFQAMVLRWWSSGLRFGGVAVTSKLRMRDVYRAYMRFLWFAILFSLLAALAAVPGASCRGHARRRRPRQHRPPARRYRHFAYWLRDRGARLLHHLPGDGAALALAVGHGIAAIIGSLRARQGAGERAAELGAGRRARRRAQCRQLLIPPLRSRP